MVSIKKLACPFCDVRLRVADTLPAGKIITCPKCGEGFPVPDGNGDTPAPKAGTTPSSYRLSSAGGAAKVKGARKAAPRPDDGQDEETEAPPKPRKRRKKAKEPTSNAPLVWGLVIGGAVTLIVGVILAVIFRPGEKKAEGVAVSDPARRAATEPGASGSAPVALRPEPRGRGPGAEPGPAAQQPVAGPSGQASAAAGPDLIAAGQSVYQANNCARCHASGGRGAGGRGPRGPDLSRAGADHTVDWLVEQIREPRSHKPDSRMPSYGDKISEDDLRALASYLASLK